MNLSDAFSVFIKTDLHNSKVLNHLSVNSDFAREQASFRSLTFS